MKRLLDDGEEYYSSLFDEDSPVDRFPDLRELFEPEDLPGCCLVASAEELEAKRAAVMDAFVAWDDEEKKPYKFDSRAQKPHLFHVLRDFEQHVLSSCYELWMFLLNHRSDPSPDARTTFCLILGSVMEQHKAMDARVAEMIVEPEMSLDFLLRLPKDVFQFLFQHHLDLDDLLALSCTCKAMRERINSDRFCIFFLKIDFCFKKQFPSFCCVWQLFSDRSPTTFLYKEDPFEGVSLDAELATLMKKPPFSLFACGHVQLVSKLQLGQQVCGKCTLHDFQRGVRRKMALHQWWKDIR